MAKHGLTIYWITNIYKIDRKYIKNILALYWVKLRILCVISHADFFTIVDNG